jgi:hypothetical protein
MEDICVGMKYNAPQGLVMLHRSWARFQESILADDDPVVGLLDSDNRVTHLHNQELFVSYQMCNDDSHTFLTQLSIIFGISMPDHIWVHIKSALQ